MSRVFLSLGSNQGNRIRALEKALEALEREAGKIIRCSSFYETRAWGFDAPDFLNAVVEIETTFSPGKLLQLIQEIERQSGRKRLPSGEYASRPLDIDILAYENRIIDRPGLKIPHPLLHRRNFVLIPWKEIAPDFLVPAYEKTVTELLSLSQDTLPVKKTGKQSDKTPVPYDFIVVEGNIGAGKTTFAKLLSDEYGARLITERFEENPFLPKFYKNPKRYAFPLEMSFLADRYQQLNDELNKPDMFSPFTVSDYFVIKSLIFAGVTLSDDEYDLYRKIFNFMYRDLRKPDLYIYFYRTPEDLLKNIAKRGREYEKYITAGYLQQVHEAYMKFIRAQKDLNVLFLDVTGIDFLENPADYERIKAEVLKKVETPLHRHVKI